MGLSSKPIWLMPLLCSTCWCNGMDSNLMKMDSFHYRLPSSAFDQLAPMVKYYAVAGFHKFKNLRISKLEQHIEHTKPWPILREEQGSQKKSSRIWNTWLIISGGLWVVI